MNRVNPELARELVKLKRDWGIVPFGAMDYMPTEFLTDFEGAMDAQPALLSQPNSGIPAYLTTFFDPEVVNIIQAPLKGADILGEEKKGTWLDEQAFFPTLENTGEVSSYGDFNDNGRSGLNPGFVQRQSYLFQTHIEYGDREEERADLAKLQWVTNLKKSAATALSRFRDYTYHFGVAGLQNYGVLNDPALSAALTPTTKAAGGTRWVTVGGQVNATSNEVYGDIQVLYNQLQTQAPGLVDQDTRLTLVAPNSVASALTATNQFGITFRKMLAEEYPNVRILTDRRYQTAGGNVVQLIADEIDGNKTGVCAFNEAMREHPLVRMTSSTRQKVTSGTWGAIIKRPLAIATMIGV